METHEFNTRMDQELEGLPPEFKQMVSCMAWEHGHSAGYGEVINYAMDFGGQVKDAVNAYNKRLGIS